MVNPMAAWRPSAEIKKKAELNAAALGMSLTKYIDSLVEFQPASKILTESDYEELVKKIEDHDRRLKKGGL